MQLGKIEDIADQREKITPGDLDVVDIVPDPRGEILVAQHDFADAADRVDGGADLMGDVGHEIVLALLRPLNGLHIFGHLTVGLHLGLDQLVGYIHRHVDRQHPQQHLNTAPSHAQTNILDEKQVVNQVDGKNHRLNIYILGNTEDGQQNDFGADGGKRAAEAAGVHQVNGDVHPAAGGDKHGAEKIAAVSLPALRHTERIAA